MRDRDRIDLGCLLWAIAYVCAVVYGTALLATRLPW